MGMEEETKLFLIKIANTVGVTLLWMMINVFFGLYADYAFFEGAPQWQNMVYYAWFIISLTALIIYLRRQWKW